MTRLSLFLVALALAGMGCNKNPTCGDFKDVENVYVSINYENDWNSSIWSKFNNGITYQVWPTSMTIQITGKLERKKKIEVTE